MPDGAKLSKRTRGKKAMIGELTAEELFTDLSNYYRSLDPGPERTRLGVELVPYLKPKLKSVDVTQTTDVRVTVSIGGPDDAIG